MPSRGSARKLAPERPGEATPCPVPVTPIGPGVFSLGGLIRVGTASAVAICSV